MTGQSFSGLRAAPYDPKKHVAQIGLAAEARTSKGKSTETHYVKKDRTGFGGGFKIPEECRVKKEQMKKKNLMLGSLANITWETTTISLKYYKIGQI